MDPHWLLRAARWARNPPSGRAVIGLLAIVALCLALFALERWGMLPDWMSATRARPPMRVQ